MSGRTEWMLDTESKIFDGKTEAEFLASSIKDVAQHYGQGMFDQKTLDWANLTQCLLIVYGGRLFAIRSNPKPKVVKAPTVQEAASANAAPRHFTPPPVNDFNGAGNPGQVDIPGLGTVEFPDDDPMSPNYKPKWN